MCMTNFFTGEYTGVRFRDFGCKTHKASVGKQHSNKKGEGCFLLVFAMVFGFVVVFGFDLVVTIE